MAISLAACGKPAPTPIAATAPPPVDPAPPADPGPVTCGSDVVIGPADSRSELGFVAGSLDKEGVRHVIRGRESQYRACYASYLTRHPADRGGRVVATFTILRTGSVGRITMGGFADELSACICHEIAQLVFPVFGRRTGSVTVSYPFTFAPSP